MLPLHRFVFSYDEKGNRIAYTHYFEESLSESKSYKYDLAGREVENASVSNNKLTSRNVTRYDDYGNRISFANFDGNGNLLVEEAFVYDDHQNMISSMSWENDIQHGKPVKKRYYEYRVWEYTYYK